MNKWALGDIEVTSILEQVASFDPIMDFFDDLTEEMLAPHRDWLTPGGLEPKPDRLVIPIQSYLLRTSHHTILIDTCVGCGKKFKWVPEWNNRDDDTYTRNLAAAGVSPADIDYVFCTHLHVDHVGWNTRLEDGRWVPTFPNAKYVFAKPEFDASAEHNSIVFRESVAPIVEAGQAEIVGMDFALNDEIWLEATTGHTAGHVAVNIASNGVRGAMSGDLIHSPLQCLHPDLSPSVDLDKIESAATRRRFLEQHAETATDILTAHFPLPSVGRLVRRDDAFWFEYRD